MRALAAALLLAAAAGRAGAALPLEDDLPEEGRREGGQGAGPLLLLAAAGEPDALSHDELRERVKALLAGAAAPEAVDAAFADPRAALLPGVEERFSGTPAEGLPYERYRQIFLTEERIRLGAAFISEKADWLARARERFGMDPHLLTALIGVETFYGRRAGATPVFGALYTIARRVPRRSSWAARELSELLRFCLAQGDDPHALLGSYAGAFGYAQFMPSSFVAYAVDFDGDGRRRWDEWPDALGSAAHYLARHGYRPGDFSPGSPAGRAVFAYNRSENYVRAVLELREAILARAP